MLLDDQFDRKRGWVAIDIPTQVEYSTLGLNDWSGCDEYFSGRLSRRNEQSIEPDVIDKATMG
jgi:hypothetical protein